MRAWIRALALPLLLLASPLAAEPAPFTPEQKAAFERLIREYLLANPEILNEVTAELERREKRAAEAAAAKAIVENREQVLANGYDFVLNPEGAVPVVQFFDYNCGFCKRMLPAFQRLQAEKDLRIVFKELPIISDASVQAARVAIAAKKQGKYLELHNLLMGFPGKVDGQNALQAAQELGLDMARLKTDLHSPEVGAEIDANFQLAEALGVRGTPTILIGETLIPGAAPYERLMAVVAERRQSCAIC